MSKTYTIVVEGRDMADTTVKTLDRLFNRLLDWGCVESDNQLVLRRRATVTATADTPLTIEQIDELCRHVVTTFTEAGFADVQIVSFNEGEENASVTPA